MQRQKDKRGDKSRGDSRREYLDAASGNESEENQYNNLDDSRHCEESRSIRTSYHEHELEKLIAFVKGMTTLSRRRTIEWTPEMIEKIQEFFLDPTQLIITIYCKRNTLTVDFNFPNFPVHELTYFGRKSLEIFQPENFHQRIIFGTVNDYAESTILKVMSTVMAPIFFKSTAWPDSVKTDFCTGLHDFLASLTNLKQRGLTLIYLPQEGMNLPVEDACKDLELLKRLKKIVFQWIKQIRLAIVDLEQTPSHDLPFIADEYNFWSYRWKNLCGLKYQIDSPPVKHIIAIMASVQSTYVEKFLALNREIDESTKEATSNIEFLELLISPCDSLNACSSPEALLELLPRILHFFRFIWLHSDYYSAQKHTYWLIGLINNQIIHGMTKFVNLNEILVQGNTRTGLDILQRCIQAIENYKELYFKFANVHDNLTSHPWDLRPEKVFRFIDVFVERCRDLIDILQAMIDFARLDETTDIPEPRFSGTKSADYEKVCARVEELFLEHLQVIKHKADKILNIQEITWHDDMFAFRAEMKNLEIIVQNLVNTVFKDMNNVREGISNLYGFWNYRNRNSLKAVLQSTTTQVWQLFANDIQHTKHEILDERGEYPSNVAYFSGRALNLRLMSKRLEATRRVLSEAEWMGQCGISEEVYHQHGTLVATVRETIHGLYAKWIDDIGDNPKSWLDRYLMRCSSDKLGLLESNLHPDVLNLCSEAKHWQCLGFQIPLHVEMINDKWDMLQFVSESVLMLVLAYNRILQAFSPEETALFRPFIKILHNKVKPGLNKLTWNSESIDTYIKDGCRHAASLQNFVDIYKQANNEILKLFEEICYFSIPKLKPKYEFSELQLEIKNIRDSMLQVIEEKCKSIIQYLRVIYEGFQSVKEQSQNEWRNYLENLDRLFEEACKLCLKNSLDVMYNILHGDESTGPSALLVIEADLINNKIVFRPALQEISQTAGNILQGFLKPFKSVKRLIESFDCTSLNVSSMWVTLEKDQSLIQCQKLLDDEILFGFNQIQSYLKMWQPFRDMWEINKDMFIKRYEKLETSVASFDADIGRYTEVANNVQMQETVTSIHFMDINSNRLKAAILEHCGLWQEKLTALLLRLTQTNVDKLYKYMAENSKRISEQPADLIAMQVTLQLYERLCAEIPKEEEEFPKIREQYQILEKYEVTVPPRLRRNIKAMDDHWAKYLAVLVASKTMIDRAQDQFKSKLLEQAVVFKRDAVGLLNKFYAGGPFTSDWRTPDALSWLANFRCEMEKQRKEEEILQDNLQIFEINQLNSPELIAVDKDLAAIEIVWQLTKDWNHAWTSYKTQNFWSINLQEMESTANYLLKKLTKLSRELKNKNWSIVDHTRQQVDNFRRTLPLIGGLKNPAMRDRHWVKVKSTIGQEFQENSDEFTLNAIAQMHMHNFFDEINDISNAASMEFSIEQGLKSIAATWQVQQLQMIATREKGVYRLQSADEIFQILEDHQVQLSAMKSTRFVDPFVKDVDQWEKSLSTVSQVLEAVLLVQRGYLYLDNIFHAEDIQKQLPKETHDFHELTDGWKFISSSLAEQKKILDACLNSDNLVERLNKLHKAMEEIQQSLEKYLELKRYIFPRFYFVSNDELLDILGISKQPYNIQPHVKKLFNCVKSLKISKLMNGKVVAEGMLSSEGEYIHFLQPVLLEGQVEYWLCQVETAMRDCLRDLVRQCRATLRKIQSKRDKWVKEWSSQPEITSTQIQWTRDCSRALVRCKLMDSKKPLRKLRRRQNQILTQYSQIIRGQLDNLLRIKIKAIVVIEIHARDVIEKMYKADCKDVSSFEWISQLRFYWDRDIDNCIVRQTNAHFIYGYEYLGNSERLVITPLTDRCYITLTTALHFYRGGSPKGPAGTGKTETVKDLAKALGFNVIVQNCSEGLDYKNMGRLFSGLAQTGAWGCFDEFNRINIEVLSVVAQQILAILTGLARKLTNFVLQGCNISLVYTCGIFITMNPGYAGRTELPDNLKSMFRPISMMVPDSSMIAEINLFSEGFEDTKILARKIFTLYSLAQQQLSKQHHYDFGLRGIVTLTRYAGKKRRQYGNLSDEEIILLAMRDMNKAKLTSDDLPLFTGITADLFPTIPTPTVAHEELVHYITAEAMKLNLQPIGILVTKVLELFETKNSRHSTMIVGQSNSGKSATWKTLRNTLTSMRRDEKVGFNVVHEHAINPKALNLVELYGEYNLSTGEWSDGVISSIMRKTCADESPDEKWILFDGPVDALWIENMNSVMDDNKILTLINNERIVMPEQVSLIFEVQDLAVASPATVSRAGMVYNDYKDLGWRPRVDSWLQNHQCELADEFRRLFDRYIDPLLMFKRRRCVETVPVPELNAVESLCKLLDVFATPDNGVVLTDDRDSFNWMCKIWFLFCSIWSVCASVNEDGRQRMDNYVREMEGAFPLKDTVYEYYVDVRQRGFVSWEEKLPVAWKYPVGTPFHEITVPTVDTVRYDYLLANLLAKGHPVLLVGPVGTGKTSMAQSSLNSLDKTKFTVLVINMSGQTTSRNVQEAIESRLEKRMRGIYVPIASKTMITFIDDLNMPAKDAYGSQPPLELIRQWIDYKFWYHRRKQTKKFIQKMQLMSAMGPPGGGRNTISNRLLTKFNVINMTFPAENQIKRIFGTMLNQQLFDFHPEVKGVANGITRSTIEIYENVVAKMLPTPGKMHYLFNLRDISKIFQGLLRSHKDYQYSRKRFLRLWIHETFRAFSDRLIDEWDRDWFVSQLNEQLGKYFELTFHNLCPEKRSPVFGSFMNASSIYDDLTDLGAVRHHMERQMDEHNALAGAEQLHLVLFRDAIEHICRIVRVISQPRGNMLLVGIAGSGRQSLSKLACYMSELSTLQVQVTKHYRVLDFREDLKRLYSMTGVDNKPTSFLFDDSQIVEEQFLEIVNNMLATGEIANLYKSDEMEEIRKCLMTEATRLGIPATPESIYLLLIERVRANLHVILSMSPIGDEFRNRLRQYPALINSTSIDWFHPWPREALLEVGNKFLMNLTISGVDTVVPTRSTLALSQQERMISSVASTFALIHNSVIQYSRKMSLEMKRFCYVTPANFLELVSGYKKMLESKRDELRAEAGKLGGGLGKLDDTRERVNVMARELEVTQLQVLQSTRHCEEYLQTIISQQHDADETQKSVTARSVRIEEESKECKNLEQLARQDLATVEPALNDAMQALDTLNKRDLAEIKSFARPLPQVEMVMAAVMILKNSEPTWAESKRQLGDVNFLSTLRNFHKDHITDKTVKAVAKYTRNPDFDPDKVGQVSVAARSLCMWVLAVEQYAKLYRIVAPKRARLQSALASLQQRENALAESIAQLRKLREELERLQQMYDVKMKEKEDLIRLADSLKRKLERAAMLVDGLSGEHVRWQKSIQALGDSYARLPGDCLVSTGFISYLGPFGSNYRAELVQIWMKEVDAKEIPCTSNLDVKEFLSNPRTIREWNIQGLPCDGFSTENGIIITHSTRWPLVIDPQCQAIRWIKKMEENNNLQVVDLTQRDLIKILEHALQFGEPVLLENVGERLDPVLKPILNRTFVHLGDTAMIKFNDKMIGYNDNFRLYVTTKLANPHYAPEISTRTTLCNFAIKEQGLEAQLLATVVRKEKPQLEEQKDNLVLAIASGKKILKELEDKILHLLSLTQSDSLLDDLDLLNTLQSAKTTSISVRQSLLISEDTEKQIDEAREAYRPSAHRASILFFILNDMSLIDPMYEFSLDSYITLFKISIDRSPRKTTLSERINALNDYHTFAVYRNSCRSLFERHKLLFAFHVCVKVLKAQGKIVPVEYDFLLQGGIVLDRENQPDKPVGWLSDETWDNITELDKLAGFRGVASSFEELSRDWHNWYISAEPESAPLPAEWENKLTQFQKMLVLRSCRLDRMTFSITAYIVQNLGVRFTEPPMLDVKAVLEDSVAQTPLIFILSPGVDPVGMLKQLANTQGMSQRFMTLSLGQGQAPIATKMIEESSESGCWVFLANCHLSLSWMPQLDKIIETLGSRKDVHPEFRLWLSSSPTSQFPISILQAGIKMTTEPPRGVKSNMKRLYTLITEDQFEICQAKGKYRKLLFTLVFFHSVLIERTKFQQLGWNITYNFNDSDFEMSENLLRVYLDEYPETPWAALKYLIAGVCYGGHVTDDWDRRLLMTYTEQFFTPEALNQPFYRLSSLPTYYVPRDGSLESYRDFIALMPSTDKPEAFGQHMNADVASLIIDSKTIFDTLMSLQLQDSAADDGTSKENKVMQLIGDIRSILPRSIDFERLEKIITIEKTPLDVVLLQEVARYNDLLENTRSSLHDLQKAIEGLILMSEQVEDIFTCIYEGRVPPPWLATYPSLQPLGSWTRDLVRRVEHFAQWAETTHPPLVFWLAAFTYPTGFLTAVLQTSARLWNLSVDALSWDFAVLDGDGERPVDGVLVRGCFLEGAGWDKKNFSLVEQTPMQLICEMPVIHFRPTDQVRKKSRNIYNCPCYYYPLRAGAPGRPSFVVTVDLKSEFEPPDFWVKRGTALLLSLAT